jgi:hypothetical protein
MTRIIKILITAKCTLAATAISAQSLHNYDINQYDTFQPVEVADWDDYRSLEPMARNTYTPMKTILGFEPVSYVCYSNLIFFQIAGGNVTLYPNTLENTTIRGLYYVAGDDTHQVNTFTLNVGLPTCRFKINIQTFAIVNNQWQAKNVMQPNLVERSLAQTWKKIRDENVSDAEKSSLTAERKRLEAEMQKGFEDAEDQFKKALASKGYNNDQILNRLNGKASRLSKNVASFASNFPASKECFFGSGHIDFSGANPNVAYVAPPPTERADDNWFETYVKYSSLDKQYDIFFSNRKCAVRMELAKEIKVGGNWVNLPALR